VFDLNKLVCVPKKFGVFCMMFERNHVTLKFFPLDHKEQKQHLKEQVFEGFTETNIIQVEK